jgi:hypothetical protein
LDRFLQVNNIAERQFDSNKGEKRVMKTLSALCGVAVLIPGAMLAQQEVSRFTFGGGAGFTTPVSSTSRNVDVGWNIRGGAGVNFNSYLGAMLDVGYDSMGINTDALNNLGFGGGRLSVFSATINPVVHVMPKTSPVDLYVTAGGGYYRLNQDFTQPGVAVGSGFNPFFGFYPVAFQTNVVVSSYSVNKPGWDAGVGVSFGHKWGGKFFAEARYNRIMGGAGNTYAEYVPVTFGFRK